MRVRIIGSALIGASLAITLAGSAMAATPQVYTWSNDVVVPYFDCGSVEIDGVWTITHRLTIFTDNEGTPIRDIEVVHFTGSFVNAKTGASIADSGHIIYFDTLSPEGEYLTTMSNSLRRSGYLHSAGRMDFQTGTYRGIDNFNDAGVAAACEVLAAN